MCLHIYSTLKPTYRAKRHKSSEIKHTATVHRLRVTVSRNASTPRRAQLNILYAPFTARHADTDSKQACTQTVCECHKMHLHHGGFWVFFFFPLTLCTQEVNTVAHTVCAACTKCNKSSYPTLSAAMPSSITLSKIYTDHTGSPGLHQCIWY